MKNFAQSLLNLWKELGLNQRVSIAIAALVVVVGLAALVMWSRRPDLQLLYGRLSEKDAAAIVSQLQAQNIPHKVTNGGATVYVPAARCDADIVNDAFPNRAPNAAAMSARYAPYGAAPRTVRPRDCVRRIPGQRALRRENSCRCAISISGCSVDEMPIGSAS